MRPPLPTWRILRTELGLDGIDETQQKAWDDLRRYIELILADFLTEIDALETVMDIITTTRANIFDTEEKKKHLRSLLSLFINYMRKPGQGIQQAHTKTPSGHLVGESRGSTRAVTASASGSALRFSPYDLSNRHTPGEGRRRQHEDNSGISRLSSSDVSQQTLATRQNNAGTTNVNAVVNRSDGYNRASANPSSVIPPTFNPTSTPQRLLQYAAPSNSIYALDDPWACCAEPPQLPVPPDGELKAPRGETNTPTYTSSSGGVIPPTTKPTPSTPRPLHQNVASFNSPFSHHPGFSDFAKGRLLRRFGGDDDLKTSTQGGAVLQNATSNGPAKQTNAGVSVKASDAGKGGQQKEEGRICIKKEPDEKPLSVFGEQKATLLDFLNKSCSRPIPHLYRSLYAYGCRDMDDLRRLSKFPLPMLMDVRNGMREKGEKQELDSEHLRYAQDMDWDMLVYCIWELGQRKN